MLTRARSLLSRVFSLDSPSSQVRLDEVFDDIEDDDSDNQDADHRVDDAIDHHYPTTNHHTGHRNGLDEEEEEEEEDEDEEFTDSDDDDEWSIDGRQGSANSSKVKGKYERQINESPPNTKTRTTPNYVRSHEKSRQNRLISAMQVATSRCNVETMRRLLSNFDIDINHRDQYGMSYLEHAILMGSFDMVDLLIRYGCDLHQGDSSGHSYLYVAIETTSNKSLPIIRLLLESNCACLRMMDIASLTSPQQLLFINSQDFLLLNAHLLFIFKYHIRRMVLSDVLNLISYFICTNILLCKNDEHYGLSACSAKHALKLEQKLKSSLNSPTANNALIPINTADIQPHLQRIHELSRQVPELRHLCRSLIRQNLKNLKSSTLESIVRSTKLQDYLLYTPI